MLVLNHLTPSAKPFIYAVTVGSFIPPNVATLIFAVVFSSANCLLSMNPASIAARNPDCSVLNVIP